MKQDVVADAAALRSGLKKNGHVEVPRMFFDFGKSEIKLESDPALKELTAMLPVNATVKVWGGGHTDNVGAVESNNTLSGARAAAVGKSPGAAWNRRDPSGAARSWTLRASGFQHDRRGPCTEPARRTGGAAVVRAVFSTSELVFATGCSSASNARRSSCCW